MIQAMDPIKIAASIGDQSQPASAGKPSRRQWSGQREGCFLDRTDGVIST